MKKIWFSLVSIALAGSLITQLGMEKATASSGSDVFGLELSYHESAFQCSGTQADIKVRVYDKDNNLLTTMSKGDKYTSTDIDSVSDLKFKYQFANFTPSHCYNGTTLYSAKDFKVLGSEDTVPTLSGYEDQQNISQMLEGLDTYKELFLVELWTNITTNSAYDLQDVILVVDNNPDSLKGAFPD